MIFLQNTMSLVKAGEREYVKCEDSEDLWDNLDLFQRINFINVK